MALSKSDLFAAISQYHGENKRPMAKNNIIATHSESAVATLKELVADGTVICRRGRNGGYYPAGAVAVKDAPVEAGNGPSSDEIVETVEVDLAEQFAMLEARLAAAEAAESEKDEVQSEQVPF